MMRSMTGYGIAEAVFNDNKITTEIRTLNSKQLDINIKLGPELRFAELDFRTRIASRLQRGKIEVSISISKVSQSDSSIIDKDIVASYLQQVTSISEELKIPMSSDMAMLLFRLPGIFNSPEQTYDESFIEAINGCLDEAISKVDTFRIKEGQTLREDLLSKVKSIRQLLSEVSPFEEARINSIRQKLLKRLTDLEIEGRYDENRLEQELVYYIEKLDINEEKVRLSQHCNYFEEICNEEQSGKKLGFIAQEMGREINTLGSKSNEADMQRLVVQMKDELERIKEQVLNIL